MTTTHPSISRYHSARKAFDNYPADYDGTKMNLQHIPTPELGGHVASSSRVDDNPETMDIVNLVTEMQKNGSKSETFLEIAPKKHWFWGTPKGNQKLVHLSRRVSHAAGGYSLTDVALRTVDLVTGEELSVSTGNKAVKDAQKLQKDVPFRLHYLDPIGLERKEENWLVS